MNPDSTRRDVLGGLDASLLQAHHPHLVVEDPYNLPSKAANTQPDQYEYAGGRTTNNVPPALHNKTNDDPDYHSVNISDQVLAVGPEVLAVSPEQLVATSNYLPSPFIVNKYSGRK